MRIALLGASSQIAKDLVRSFAAASDDALTLFARRPEVVSQWLQGLGLPDRYAVAPIQSFGGQEDFDAVINCVGVGAPAQTVAMGSSILDVTLQYDEMVLAYLKQRPDCKYLSLSSGAAYGSNFEKPASNDTVASFPINHLSPQDWYGLAKFYAEARHRALPQRSIVDLRIFSYFSHTQDLDARFLMTDILRSIRDQTLLQTSSDYMVRDYILPADFYQLVRLMLDAAPVNLAVDCYSLAPVDKPTLLSAMQSHFGLHYQSLPGVAGVNASGNKTHYYSLNRRLKEFGYQPRYSSLDGILHEVSLFFKKMAIP